MAQSIHRVSMPRSRGDIFYRTLEKGVELGQLLPKSMRVDRIARDMVGDSLSIDPRP